ncbi:hypothetical protein NDU88_003317 [Pleurodeles waltl]|uniref:Uncharacterized protein n=1 Tax=Pleurodeles waltl TaxID=8319 RepID=A0AAV7QF47_PLEWA|nr:hypothetical protein NDU88_003317 [Pleurodeles waltl]
MKVATFWYYIPNQNSAGEHAEVRAYYYPNVPLPSSQAILGVEIAVLTLSNVLHQINKLYSKPHLSFEQKKLEPFLASLGQQISDLRDCVSMNTFNVTSQGQTRKAIDEHFKKLEDISSEKTTGKLTQRVNVPVAENHVQTPDEGVKCHHDLLNLIKMSII